MIYLFKRHIILFSLLIISATDLFAQRATISGTVMNKNNEVLFPASIAVINEPIGTTNNTNGTYELLVPTGETLIIHISYLGYKDFDTTLVLEDDITLNINLSPTSKSVEAVNVISDQSKTGNLVSIDLNNIENIPNTTGNIENIIKTMAGVRSNNELSSQYSVRGGSYDENLIYINDIEVYRPFLITSGQQEGLSFINPDMVASLQFSSGGFNAEYGDKMSSVLDIKYKRPERNEGKVSASLLGFTTYFGSRTKNNKCTQVSSFRYKTSQYLLNSLETTGDYKPEFYDFQTYLTYDISSKLEMSFFGNIALNKYTFKPKLRYSTFGTLRNPLGLYINYEGQEIDKFLTGIGGLTATYRPKNNLSVKLITSYYNSDEEVTYDKLGRYSLNRLDNTVGSSSFGDSTMSIGVGTTLEHARNFMDINVYSSQLRLTKIFDNGATFKVGYRYQYQTVQDYTNQWIFLDSADYSSPYNDDVVTLNESVQSNIDLIIHRHSAFVQYAQNYKTENFDITGTFGFRSSILDINRKPTLSPRFNLVFTPIINPKLAYTLSGGVYHQPPFYKELKNPNGTLTENIKSQVSYQLLAGLHYNFLVGNKPFILTSELYYKYFPVLTIYKINNVNLQYLPEYEAKGYTMGFDIKINGEIIPGTESWMSVSLLKTEEDVHNDKIFIENELSWPGYYPRPTNQYFNFSMYVQDYLPMNPEYKVHLTLHYGSRLTTSPVEYNNPAITFTLPAYRRIDVGISKSILKKWSSVDQSFLKESWISFEILNLFNFENTISYYWIKTVNNQDGINNTFAVPNQLTSLLVNLKITAKF